MTDAINAKSAHELSSEALDAVSGGSLASLPLRAFTQTKVGADQQGGQNDPAQMFQQILQQLTQGAN
jgi:hypothetical protein